MGDERRFRGFGGSSRRQIAAVAPVGGHTIPSISTILGAAYHTDIRADDANRVMAGSKVAALFNYGPDASDMLQSTDLKRLTYSASAFNGGPGLIGDGVATEMVATFNTALANGSRPYIWWIGQITGILATYYLGGAVDAIPNGAGYNFVHSTSANFVQDRGSSDGATGVNGSASDTNRVLLEFGLTAGGTASLVVNGTAFDSTKTGGANGALTKAILMSAGGLLSAAGTWARMVIATSVTAQQVTDARAYWRGANFPNYLNSSYGLP